MTQKLWPVFLNNLKAFPLFPIISIEINKV